MRKDRSLNQIWGKITILMIWIALASGCGLPQYASLEKPIVLDTGSSTVLGFETPADPGVNGFALYYKIYSDTADYDLQDDERYFDENTYINDEDEFPPGDKVPRERGFVLAGNSGDTSFPNRFTFPNLGPGTNILINFYEDELGRKEPEVGEGPFPITDPAIPIVTVLETLARGFIDYRDLSNDKLRGFVNDWYYQIEDGDVTEAELSDGDLIRPPGIQPGTSKSDISLTNRDVIPGLGPDHNQLIISFVVHSVGYDIASGTLTPLDSVPVHIGNIIYSSINSTTARTFKP